MKMKQLKAGGVVNIRHKVTGDILLSVSGNNLIGANLTGAILTYANLQDVNLTGANLQEANLQEANLMWTDLTDVNLTGANLRKSDLRGARLPKDITFIKGLRWDVAILEGFISIGCKTYAIEEWEKFTDEEISKMDDDALEFWMTYKGVILEIAKEIVK